MTAKIASLQDELNTATQKLNEMTAEQAAEDQRAQAAAQAAQAAHAAQAAKTAHASAIRRTARRPAVDPRWNQIQSRLDAQQKELEETNTTLNQTRSDLEGSISSTRDQLGGSIAKNHDELVALEQRGERNYYEFDISKSKGFARTGPIELSLRKADAKHKHYNLALMIDDNEIQKKNVDLYEPIWLRDSDDPQPLEIVVNKIDKDSIHGYVSSSKYTQAQLTPAAASSNTGASQAPAASNNAAPATSNPQSN